MTKHEEVEAAVRRAPGSLSTLSSLRGMLHLDANEGAKGGALALVPAPNVDTADGMKKAVAELVEAHNRLVEREKSGRVVTDFEWTKLDEGLRELSGRMKATEEALRAGADGTRGGPEFLLDKAALRLEPPDDISANQRSYFNVVALKFEELAGIAHMSGGQRLGSGVSEKVSRLYGSPGAARLRETQERLQFLNDVLLVKDVLMAPGANRGARADLSARLSRMKQYREWPEYEKLATEFARTFNETTTTAGLNWVPTVLSAQMMDLVQAELRVAALFPQVTMTSKTLDWPVLGGDLTAFLMGEAVTDPGTNEVAATTAVTNKVTFTAKKLGVRTFASSEVIEDSIVDMVSFILANAAKVLARGIEDWFINGEDGTTMDGATFNPANGVRRAGKGLRFYTLMTGSYPAKVDNLGAAIGIAKSLDVQMGMGVFGATPSAFAWVTGFRGMKSLMKLPEMITLEKFGPNATILTGQVGSYFGSPVILSEFVFDQKSTGVFGDGTARTFGSLIGVYRPAWAVATRRAIGINASSDRYIEQDQTVFVGTSRNDFQPFFTPSATVAPAGILFNIV